MSTTTKPRTLQSVLDESNPNEIADALRKAKLGTALAPLKRTFAGLAGAAAFDLTAIDGTGEIVGKANPNRLPARTVLTLRVTAATTANTVGSYHITDAGGTALTPTAGANVGLAKLSDDGKTITFPTADVTAFVIEYSPLTMSAADMAADFAPST